jgi:hypothetical protein
MELISVVPVVAAESLEPCELLRGELIKAMLTSSSSQEEVGEHDFLSS